MFSLVVAIFLGMSLLFISLPFYLTYLIYREFILKIAHAKANPAPLFAISIAFGYGWLCASTAIVSVILYSFYNTTLFSIFSDSNCFIIMTVSSMAGIRFWINIGKEHFSRGVRYREVVARIPLFKLQFWLQDILIASVSLALSMTLSFNIKYLTKNRDFVIAITIFEVLTQAIMFIAFIDMCRFSELMKNSRTRAIYLFTLMFVNTFFPYPLLTAFGWNVWRRALFLVQEADLTLSNAPKINVTPVASVPS